MKTFCGSGSGNFGTGTMPAAPNAPVTAANSASCESSPMPTTPIPPTSPASSTIPSPSRALMTRYSGIPPAFTGRSNGDCGYGPSSGWILPVTMPAPQPLASAALHGLSFMMPSSERARGRHWPGFQSTPKSQPRFDCSMP